MADWLSNVGFLERQVHQVIRLATEEPKRSRKDGYDPTREGATSAVLSRALRRVGRARRLFSRRAERVHDRTHSFL